MYEVVSHHLVSYGLNKEDDGWKRIIVEKPFGYSFDSAVELDKKLHEGFQEHQITVLTIIWAKKRCKILW